MQLPFVVIEDQGLRDGLQTLPQPIAVEQKLQLIEWLLAAGLRRLQVASFVHPKLVPQMADADVLCRQLPKKEGVVFSGLVLNLKGVERAIEAGLTHLAISLSASETHSQKNANKTIAEAKAEFKAMVALAQHNGITVRGGIQCAFGCRYEGRIEEAVVLDLVRHHIDCGVPEIALADSTGMAHPLQMKKTMQQVLAIANTKTVALHLHNTENKGYANLVAALEVGVRQFDTAFGGLGGCPFIKDATGNIATEDTVHLLQQMGFETGIDWRKASQASEMMQSILGTKLPGLLYGLANKTDLQIL
jgi:hydroxymethylglutaryl-CoA lyase